MSAKHLGALAVAVLLAATPALSIAIQPFKVMIVTWRGCEDACRGLQDHFKSRRIDAEFVLRDAEGRKDRLPAYLAEARAERVDLIVTYGTNVTRGIAGTLADRNNPALAPEIPKVFMIVADPVGAGVVESLERTGRSDVTGTYNRVPESVNIETLRAYDPSFKRLGLLFHRDERNSIDKRDELAALTKSMKFELVAREFSLGSDGRPRSGDIATKLGELKEAGVDFVYLGSSSFLRDHGEVVGEAALNLGLPVLSPYESIVRDSQALLSVAARYAEVGRLAGMQAEKILVERIRPGDLPVARMMRFAIVVNMHVAKKLKRFPPLELLQIAETVQ